MEIPHFLPSYGTYYNMYDISRGSILSLTWQDSTRKRLTISAQSSSTFLLKHFLVTCVAFWESLIDLDQVFLNPLLLLIWKSDNLQKKSKKNILTSSLSACVACNCTWCGQHFTSVSVVAPKSKRKNVILHVSLYFFIFLTV